MSWHLASYVTGAIDDRVFLVQPSRIFVRAQWLLARAIRADHDGQADQAVTEYRDYLALPAWQRDDAIDPVIGEFIAWRLTELGDR